VREEGEKRGREEGVREKHGRRRKRKEKEEEEERGVG
jgi:hypothetical protein